MKNLLKNIKSYFWDAWSVKERVGFYLLLAVIVASVSFTIYMIVYMIVDHISWKKQFISKETSYEFTVQAGDSDYYYHCLSDNQKELYKAIHQEMERVNRNEKDLIKEGDDRYCWCAFEYDEFNVSQEEAENTVKAFYLDTPSFFGFSDVYRTVGEDYMRLCFPAEYAEYQERMDIQREIDDNVSKISKTIDTTNETTLDKVAAIYDFLINNTQYERDEAGEASEAAHAQCMAGALDQREETNSICQGYAMAFSYLCNLLDVNCLCVGSSEIKHAFNVVNVDGVWYYIDATNEDGLLTYFLCGEKDYWGKLHHRDSPVFNSPDGVGSEWLGSLPELSQTGYPRAHTEGALSFELIIDDGRVGWELKDCDGTAESAIIPDVLRGGSVIAIDYSAFKECVNLTELTIPKTVKEIATLQIDGLKKVNFQGTLENWCQIEFLYSSIGDTLFEDNISIYINGALITDLTVPASVSKINSYAFQGWKWLERLEIPSNVIEIGSCAFDGCYALREIVLSKGIKSIKEGAFELGMVNEKNVYYDGTLAEWLSVSFEDYTASPLLCVKEANFYIEGELVTEVKIPEYITVIQPWFAGCTSITSIELGCAQKIMKDVFWGCKNLKTVIVPKTVAVIEGRIFFNCKEAIVYCEAPQASEGWDSAWQSGCKNVIWNYT